MREAGIQKPYQTRSDPEKLLAQWKKISGLCLRKDWSAAVVRAATAVEIAANIAVRKLYDDTGETDVAKINLELKNANGMVGKLKKILEKKAPDEPQKVAYRAIRGACKDLNVKRNSNVHSGEFCNKREARLHI